MKELYENEENKLTLDGEIVKAEPLGKPITILSLPKDLEVLVDMSSDELLKRQIEDKAPSDANAYCLGEPVHDPEWPVLPKFHPTQFYRI